MAFSSTSVTPSPLLANNLASFELIAHRIHQTLANSPGFILHRSLWQCLASSYSEMLQALTRFLQPASSAHGTAALSLTTPLHALHEAMLEGERCLSVCITNPSPPFNHTWLLDKALKLGSCTDVVDLHLQSFLCAFSSVLDCGLNILPRRDNLESELVQLTTTLSDIWAHANAKAKDDLSSLCSFLTEVRCKEEGDTSSLANFILQKLSHGQEWEIVAPDALPACLWVDSDSLQRNPEILGIGGYGKVHEAVWLGGHFAVKDFFYVENNAVFGREAAIQARLRHPNVMSLVCCTKKPSLHKCSLVMELMQQDLRVRMLERLEAGMSPPFPLGVAVDLMLQISQGMEYLHSIHIMHRDLKSSNILVSFSRKPRDPSKDDLCSFPHLKITDFGMSKAKHASSKYTTKHVGATPWRAPEVFEINPEDEVEGDIDAKYTKKADVYSFALVCYEILTGKSPFEGPQVKKRVLAGERPTLPSYCPRALSSYIESCWNADPLKRPPFSQICRVLRYLKVAVQLQDYNNRSSAPHYSWLSQPLSDIVCARIDDMVRSFIGPRGSLFWPQPLSILLEMYCCRIVLQQTGQSLSIFNDDSDSDMGGITITQTSFDFNEPLEKSHMLTSKLEQGQGKSPWKAKNYVFQWLKKLFCMHDNHHPKSEVLDALGLLRDFTFNELKIASTHFSKMIGEGGNGKVYYGRLEDGREIAVKVAMRPKALQNGRFFSVSETMGLVQELKIASQLRHRNIVPLFGWCQARGKFYLIYEFMVHGSVARHIFGEPDSLVLNWQQRFKIAGQLASALKYLHQDSGYLQIVHRDVNVHNVLLDSEWNARLGDCGLALLLRDGHSPLHHLAGTVGYIAPECVVQRRVSPASDVYAFGVTILVIVSGRRACSYKASSETYFLRDWVWDLFQQGHLIKVADVRLKGQFDDQELKRLLLLGLSCSSANPQLRPCMEEVLKILSGLSEPPALKIQKQSDSATEDKPLPLVRRPFIPKVKQNISLRMFPYKELKLATSNFRDRNLLGEGGFGTVYKGSINETGSGGTTIITVAVKVLDSMSSQGHKEWLTEVFFLGQLHHPNLVKLKGYCSEDEHRILVYEHMANGSLGDHLFRKAALHLTWATRMKIALGAAKGLSFLHQASVILRDLKTNNILLDTDYTAKLSDFGLAKEGPLGDKTHVSTRVMGTFGYVAPEYIMTGHLTSKSDVYSFGVVLLELVTGQRVLDRNRGRKEQSLVRWAQPYLRDKRAFQQIVDPRLNGIYSAKGAYKAASIAFRCLSSEPKSRPSMSDLVQKLESLQDTQEMQE